MAKTRIKQPAIEAAQDKTEVTAFIRQIGDLQREVKRLETEAGDKKSGYRRRICRQSRADVCRNHEPDRTCGRLLRSA